MTKRLQEIAARRAAIRAEIDAAPDMSTEDLQARNQEVDTLRQEQERLESRQRLIDGLEPAATPSEPKPEERAGLSVTEQRAADLRQSRSISLPLVGETRAITLGATPGLVKPKDNSSAINQQPFVEVSSIIDLVKTLPLVGMTEYSVPYQKTTGTADKTTEGSETHGNGDPTFDYAVIKPVVVTTYSEISRECIKLTDADYYSRVLDSARVALRKKVTEYIIKSDAASNATFIGVLDADAVEDDDDVEITAINDKTLRLIAMNYGGEEGIEGNAVLFLSKKDLIAFGDVRGTNEKKAVYEITPDSNNPNTGIIKDGGLSVRYCLNANLTSLASATAGDYTMVYGVPTCYELGIFSDFTVRVSEDAAFKRRMIAVLGEVMIGGNVTVSRGFLRAKKGA